MPNANFFCNPHLKDDADDKGSAPPTATPAPSTPAWLVIDQHFMCIVLVASPVKEKADVTVPRTHPRPSSPGPESSHLSSAFSIVSKCFTFFTRGTSDSDGLPMYLTTSINEILSLVV